jgi:hypothetical protein
MAGRKTQGTVSRKHRLAVPEDSLQARQPGATPAVEAKPASSPEVHQFINAQEFSSWQ